MMNSAKTTGIAYHSEDMLRMAILTFGFKDFPCAMVTFINSEGGEHRDHPVRPFLHQTEGMQHAKHFVETGEVVSEGQMTNKLLTEREMELFIQLVSLVSSTSISPEHLAGNLSFEICPGDIKEAVRRISDE